MEQVPTSQKQGKSPSPYENPPSQELAPTHPNYRLNIQAEAVIPIKRQRVEGACRLDPQKSGTPSEAATSTYSLQESMDDNDDDASLTSSFTRRTDQQVSQYSFIRRPRRLLSGSTSVLPFNATNVNDLDILPRTAAVPAVAKYAQVHITIKSAAHELNLNAPTAAKATRQPRVRTSNAYRVWCPKGSTTHCITNDTLNGDAVCFIPCRFPGQRKQPSN
ncbi:hypothetical protein HPB47_021896 [Ixodes persulcatus]|uniref:Uncharacterized protein n=1 Tax=Ixodes persulcatus TaxID=34615 RepID=A0AC60QBH3_IXOPE|nr:hypothetical protein HPB47_021896 [Ixodes persulcatus]